MSDIMRLAGINSGYDTEAMIEKMMQTYQSKIDKQNQKLQKLTWQQEAYRDITNKLTTFKNKYFDILKRDTYLMSPSSFNKFKSTVTNKTNSDKTSGISVITSSNSRADNYKIKVNQIATATKLTGNRMKPDNFELDMGRAADFSDYTVENGNRKYNFALDVKVGDVTKSVEFDVEIAEDAVGKINMDDFTSKVQTALNEKFEEAFGITGKTSNITGGTNADGDELFLSVEKSGETLQFKVGGNADVTVTEKTGDFGLARATSKSINIAAQSCVTGKNTVTVSVGSKAITTSVTFDGVSETYFDSKDKAGNEAILREYNALKVAAWKKENKTNANPTESQLNNFSYTSVQAAKDKNSAALVDALNRSSNMLGGAKFSMDDKGNLNCTEEFSITATAGGTLGIRKGSTSNKFAKTSTLREMGVAGENEDIKLTINGKDIYLKNTATVDDLVNAVNKSGAGVTMTYSKLDNKFIVTSNDLGNGGDVVIEANKYSAALGLAADRNTKLTAEIGQNAIFELDGVELYHNSNSYEIDGTTIKFGEAEIGSEYEIGVTKNFDDIKQTIKDFVNDYNQMIEDIRKYTDTTPKRDKKNNLYEPLTDAQKEDMSEDEIKKWEEAAKQGILFNDSTVTGILSKIRMALYNTVKTSDGSNFGIFNMGIQTMSYREDSADDAALGKLKLDEDAFDKAFEENADAIIKLFTDADTGIMKKVNTILDDTVRTTGQVKGTLIRKAGLEKGTTAKDNEIYRRMEEINKRIQTLQNRYDAKEEYWWNVFTNLEKMMTNMNSQMNYMASYLGSNTTQQ